MSRSLLAARPRTTLYREDRPEGAVVLKVLAAGATAEDARRLENDLRISEGFEEPCLRRGLGRASVDGRPAAVLEYAEGTALSARVVGNVGDVCEVLRIASSLARALAALHLRRVVHRDLKPSNVIQRPSSSDVVLIDFGLSARLLPSLEALPPSTELEGTLAYIAPEQTGRTGQSVDTRADLYAFGATLYELCAGRPPFDVADAAQIVHSHLARTPLPLHRANPLVPEMVSAVVARLLAKNPEERYHSALAVAADLERCERELSSEGSVQPFVLNLEVAGRFELPTRLYGRDSTIAALDAAFDAIADGGRGVILVEGKPGVGKTVVVRRVHAALAARGAWFAEGRFDAHRHQVPYDALRTAFAGLIREVLALGDAELEATCQRLRQWLGPAAAALSPIAPGLERLLLRPGSGEALAAATPTSVAELPAGEAKTRLLYLARGFVAALAATRPIVLFLDDLQWADLASLDLLESLITDPEPGRLLLIGGLRTSNAEAAHVVRARFSDWRAARVRLETISIDALTDEQVRDLVSDTMRARSQDVLQLSSLIFARTRGNAFFVRRLLALLHARGAIAWDAAQSCWRLDQREVARAEIGDDVAELLGAELSALSPVAQRLVALAAAVGHEVDLLTLSAACEQRVAELRTGLGPAIAAGLLIPLGQPAAWTEDHLSPELERSLAVRFAHDHVQEAAYRLVEVAERPALHLKLGLLLAERSPGDRGRLFEVASQLARGAAAAKPAQSRSIAELLIDAGSVALSTAAHTQAASLLQTALALLGASPFEAEPSLALSATSGLAEAEHQLGRLERAESLAREALAHTRTPTERLGPVETLILVAIEQNDMRRAIELGLEALAALGVFIPLHPGTTQIVRSLLGLRLRLLGKAPESLAGLPEMNDEAARVAMAIAQRTVPAAFRAGSKAFPLLVFRMVELSLRHGNCSVSPFAWGGYAITLSGVLGAYDAGYAFGRLGLALAERFADPRQTPGMLFVWANFLRHWKEPLANSLEPLRDAFRIGMESGDQFTATWSATYRAVWSHALGAPLPEVDAELDRSAELASKDRGAWILHRTLRQVVACFAGRAVEPARLHGEHVDEAALDLQLAADSEATQVFIVHYYRLLLALSFGDPVRAVAEAELAEERLEVVTGLPWVPLFAFYATLARLACERRGAPRDRRIKRAVARFRVWARHDPAGKNDRLLLLEAELERTRGNGGRARLLYDRAIEAARQAGRRDVEGMGLELAAEALDEASITFAAQSYRERAAQIFRAMGASARVDRLSPPELGASLEPTTGTPSSAPTVDLTTVFKASAALSAEMHVPRLLSRMMSILVENGGAQRGVLVLQEDDTLVVEAEQESTGDVRVGPALPLSQVTNVAQAVIRRVARSGTAEVIDDAQAEPTLAASAHVAKSGVHSILCAPIKHQGKLAGVLYLENNLARAAFTPARVELLSLLATQAAIALENARLYERQVALTNAHRRFVPHEFLESLGRRSIGEVELGDSVQKEMTVLFSDIRGFTTHVEDMSPEENIAFINRYLKVMEPAIVSAGGFVEGYVGDAILALFDRGAGSALAAALAMLRALAGLNRARAADPRRRLSIGIGVNTGPLTLGTIGGPNRIKCGVIGDSVNVAARIESLTKLYGVPLLVSGDTLTLAARSEAYRERPIDTVRVVGRNNPVALHEIYDADSDAVRDAKDGSRALWQEARELYCAGDFAVAERCFASYAERVHGDAVSDLYRRRCAEFAQRRPAGWDGITVLDRK